MAISSDYVSGEIYLERTTLIIFINCGLMEKNENDGTQKNILFVYVSYYGIDSRRKGSA